MSDITRSEAIKTLKEHLSHWERLLQEHICEEQEGIDTISALKLAIASLETDEAYQLEYERTTKNDLAVDAVSRKAVLDLIADYDLSMGQVVKGIHALPSVTPQPRKGHWKEEFNDLEGEVRFTCSSCGKYQLFGTDFCYYCGSDNREVVEE